MRRLHYFAIEIWPDRMAKHPFTCAVDAEEGARILAKLAPAAVAYQQWGDVEAEVWDEPDPLLVLGSGARRVVDQDGREDWMHHAA